MLKTTGKQTETQDKDMKIGTRKTNSAARANSGSMTLNSKTINLNNQRSAEKKKEGIGKPPTAVSVSTS